MAGLPSAGYKFNNIQEIKSHSSVLYNERMAILFYLLDMKSIELNSSYDVSTLLYVKSVLNQIYKNCRMLIRNNPTMRATLNLETKDRAIYITDVAKGTIDRMIEWCEMNGYTSKKIFIIVQELNNFEIMLKDILQYYHYFIRPDFRQKPDIELAVEKYKDMADKRTIEELREVVGKRHKIDFESLGGQQIELAEQIEYDETVDGEKEAEENIEEWAYLKIAFFQ